jgi:hypothetical protein
MTFGCQSCGQAKKIQYGGRWWLPPSSGHGEFCESMFAHGLFMYQKCFNYAHTNLLFGLYRFVWIIDLLVTLPNPYFKAPSRPSTHEMLRAKEHTPIFHSSVVFTLDSHLILLRSLGVHHFYWWFCEKNYLYILQIYLYTLIWANMHFEHTNFGTFKIFKKKIVNVIFYININILAKKILFGYECWHLCIYIELIVDLVHMHIAKNLF